MLLLIKNSISSLSPSINRGWLSVGSRRACGRLCEWRQGATEVSCPLAEYTGLSGGTALIPSPLGAYICFRDP